MDLRQLKYFRSMVHSGSFAAASQVLNISQTAIGYQIRRLEDSLGTPLLVRGARGVWATEAGKVLCDHVENIFDAVQAAEVALDPFRHQLTGEITVGVTPTSGRALGPELLNSVAEETRLRVNLRQGMSNARLQEVISGKLDLALCYDPPSTDRIRLISLYREPLMAIGIEELLGAPNTPIDFDELVTLPLLLDDRLQTIRQAFDHILEQKKLPKPNIMDLDPIELKREMIVNHRRIAVAPYGLFLDEIQQGRVRARVIRNPVIMRNMKRRSALGFPIH